MSTSRTRPRVGGTIFLIAALALGLYFAFGAIQGPYGLFERVEVQAEARRLKREREQLRSELASLENLTRRMSDDYLDLDLLDEQARSVLGLARTDEIIFR